MKQPSLAPPISSELSSPWRQDLAECQTSIAPADALASLPGVHGVWGALSILLRRKALPAAYSQFVLHWGVGVAPQKSPGDSEIWERRVCVCCLQLPRGRVSRLVSLPIRVF